MLYSALASKRPPVVTSALPGTAGNLSKTLAL